MIVKASHSFMEMINKNKCMVLSLICTHLCLPKIKVIEREPDQVKKVYEDLFDEISVLLGVRPF